MRWKPLEGRDMPRPVQFVITVPVLIILSPLMAAVWLDDQFHKHFGPKAEWSPWFAWRPVRTDHGFGEAVWLETIERRAWYSRTIYRTVDTSSKSKDNANG